MYIGVMIMAAFMLGACWYLDEASLRTRIIYTVLYMASWGLFFLPGGYGFVFYLAQIVLILVIGIHTFGIDWFMDRR
jgi:hypothetical protein